MGATRRTTTTPIPDHLPEGLVEDRTPFIRTRGFGHHIGPIEQEDEGPVRDASMAFGEAIVRVLSRGFVTEVG